jgi:hypothetical protein
MTLILRHGSEIYEKDRMSDPASSTEAQAHAQNQLKLEFVMEVRQHLDWMHGASTQLEALDPISWDRMHNIAHNIGARANALNLGVMQSCTRELEQFAASVTRGPADERSNNVERAMVAIETLELELAELRRNADPI